MEVSEDLQRELVYGLNAALLAGCTAEMLANELLQIIDTEGPRFHEPALIAEWTEATGMEVDELQETLESVVVDIVEELNDEEDPWSAHRLLALLAEESFWVLRWGHPSTNVPVPARTVAGIALPAVARPPLVGILDALELTLFEARQDNRSVHDPVPERLFDAALDHALHSVRQLGDSLARANHSAAPVTELIRPTTGRLPGLRDALATVQRWKLSVEFDAHPDEDDGEWTLRVLERLYSIEWKLR